jgi:hypothetical protein
MWKRRDGAGHRLWQGQADAEHVDAHRHQHMPGPWHLTRHGDHHQHPAHRQRHGAGKQQAGNVVRLAQPHAHKRSTDIAEDTHRECKTELQLAQTIVPLQDMGRPGDEGKQPGISKAHRSGIAQEGGIAAEPMEILEHPAKRKPPSMLGIQGFRQQKGNDCQEAAGKGRREQEACPPAKLGFKHAAKNRRHCRHQAHKRAHHRQHAGCLAAVEQVAHDGAGQHDSGTRPDGLRKAGDDQQVYAWCHRAGHRCDEEQGKPTDQHRLAAQPVR